MGYIYRQWKCIYKSYVIKVCSSPDGKYSLQVVVGQLENGNFLVVNVKCLTDGSMLVTSSSHGAINLWDGHIIMMLLRLELQRLASKYHSILE